MERRQFGHAALKVPTVGLGTWRTFDVRGAVAEANCHRVVDSALAWGANLFDTSPMYGEAERVLADALRGRRDQAFVATKVWSTSRAGGRRQIEQALRWYGGYVDIYQIHNLVAWREFLPILEELKAAGQVGVIGATHYSHRAFPELLTVMRTGRIEQVQIPLNVADRAVEQDVLPMAAELGLGVLVMEPFGSGSLTRRAPSPGQLEPLRAYGVTTWAQALLKWILSDPRVHCVIPATRRPERMRENAAAGEPPWLDEEARTYVGKLAASL
jgi:aryl-alcohol dehydrogenase-like predicted oxidoreductase